MAKDPMIEKVQSLIKSDPNFTQSVKKDPIRTLSEHGIPVFRQELYEKECITTISMDTSTQERGRIIFQITEIGEKIIYAYNQHNFALVLGPLNDTSEAAP